MASNRRTDLAILHAPKSERIFIHQTAGANREQRRAQAAYPSLHRRRIRNQLVANWSFAESYPTDNWPYRKAA